MPQVSSLQLLLVAVGLSMDAFAVSICKGLSIKRLTIRNALWVGLWFGAFQALMPLIGYLLGVRFAGYITSVDHWIAFALLTIIGAKMLWESFQEEKGDENASLGVLTMLPLAVATSIDALAVGVTLALLAEVSIVPAVCLIGLTTFVLSAFAVQMGHKLGLRWGTIAERLGGGILICMGLGILIEHLYLI